MVYPVMHLYSVFSIKTASGRTWENISVQFIWLCIFSTRTGTRRIMRLEELSIVVRRSRRISKDSSSRRIMRLVSVLALKTYNQKNYSEMFF